MNPGFSVQDRSSVSHHSNDTIITENNTAAAAAAALHSVSDTVAPAGPGLGLHTLQP